MRNIDRARRLFIDKHRENASLVKLNELDFEKYTIKRILYEDLHKHDLYEFYPIASQYVDENLNPSDASDAKLCFYFAPVSHEIYLGTTGSGKTTGCVEPQLRAITSTKRKPHIFITDPKGEIFEHNAVHLESMGYRIRLLNFKDGLKTNFWNPLGEIYDTYITLRDVGKNAEERSGKISKDLAIMESESPFSEKLYYVYDGRAFATKNELEDYFASERSRILTDTEDLVMQFLPMIIDATRGKEPIWEEGAQRILRGLVYYMLEEISLDENDDNEYSLTRQQFTLKTIDELYTRLNNELFDGSDKRPLLRCPTFQHKKESDYSVQLLRPILDSADSTTKGFISTFDSSVQKWFNKKILNLTLDDTMDVDFESDEPMAIFLITRDYEKTDFLVAGLFIDWMYRKAIEAREKGVFKRELHFLLDEFGNIPAIKNFENKIATARSRNIWFHLILQSYAQLHNVYDSTSGNAAGIIKDNCNSQVFLGSQNYETKVEFSKQCGQKTYPDFKATLGGPTNFVTSNVLPISDLDLIETGHMYNKRIYMPVITSFYVRSYLCKEFAHDRDIDGFSIVPMKIINPDAAKYSFKFVNGRKQEKKEPFNLDFLFDNDDDF